MVEVASTCTVDDVHEVRVIDPARKDAKPAQIVLARSSL